MPQPRIERPLNKHSVHFYKDSAALFPTVVRYLEEGLAEEACVVIATERHRQAFEAMLLSSGTDVDFLRRAGRLTMLDAERTLASFMREDMPDPALFHAAIAPVMRAASQGGEVPVRAYGEMVDILWRQEKVRQAIRLEQLWNQLASELPFSLLCAYQIEKFGQLKGGLSVKDICRTHSHSIALEDYGAAAGHVLVAEDDEDDYDFLQRVFEKNHPRVQLENARNGEEVMSWLQQNRLSPPAFMMLDLNMPLKDGREVLRELRQDEHFDQMPVVVLTTSAAKADERFTDCFKNTYFFTKPVGISNLESLVRTIVMRHLPLA